MPFADAVEQLVLRPVGLRGSGVDDDSLDATMKMARGYEPAGTDGLKPANPIHWSLNYPYSISPHSAGVLRCSISLTRRPGSKCPGGGCECPREETMVGPGHQCVTFSTFELEPELSRTVWPVPDAEVWT